MLFGPKKACLLASVSPFRPLTRMMVMKASARALMEHLLYFVCCALRHIPSHNLMLTLWTLKECCAVSERAACPAVVGTDEAGQER